MPNPYGKTRPVDNPYAVYTNRDGSWVWKILKVNQTPARAVNNPYATAFCVVTSSFAPGGDRGDTYLSDIGQYHKAGADILKECGRISHPSD